MKKRSDIHHFDGISFFFLIATFTFDLDMPSSVWVSRVIVLIKKKFNQAQIGSQGIYSF